MCGIHGNRSMANVVHIVCHLKSSIRDQHKRIEMTKMVQRPGMLSSLLIILDGAIHFKPAWDVKLRDAAISRNLLLCGGGATEEDIATDEDGVGLGLMEDMAGNGKGTNGLYPNDIFIFFFQFKSDSWYEFDKHHPSNPSPSLGISPKRPTTEAS